jgi:hypothetical protein
VPLAEPLPPPALEGGAAVPVTVTVTVISVPPPVAGIPVWKLSRVQSETWISEVHTMLVGVNQDGRLPNFTVWVTGSLTAGPTTWGCAPSFGKVVTAVTETVWDVPAVIDVGFQAYVVVGEPIT